MKGDLISCNGVLSSWDSAHINAEELLGGDFVYQKIHTLAHSPLHTKLHLEILEHSFRELYGGTTGLSEELLNRNIRHLLEQNRIPKGSNLVGVYIIPSKLADGPPVQLLCLEKQLVNRGYTLWHSPLVVVIMPCEVPFPQHKTALSLSAHNLVLNQAIRSGSGGAVAENRNGVLTSLGENPLFGIRGSEVVTTPIDCGVAHSVERILGISACEAVGLTLLEEPITRDHIPQFEEMFSVTPQGVTSIGKCLDRLFPKSMAKNIAAQMQALV